ncbi:hypothetical protein PFISCL1PPCAC_6744, partial [Pristionchus fissidentatus]
DNSLFISTTTNHVVQLESLSFSLCRTLTDRSEQSSKRTTIHHFDLNSVLHAVEVLDDNGDRLQFDSAPFTPSRLVLSNELLHHSSKSPCVTFMVIHPNVRVRNRSLLRS